jgi:hypothetical protein
LVSEAPLPQRLDAFDQARSRCGGSHRGAHAAQNQPQDAQARPSLGTALREQASIDPSDERFVTCQHHVFGVELAPGAMRQTRLVRPAEQVLEFTELPFVEQTSAGTRAPIVEVVVHDSPSITSRNAG